MKRIIVFLLFAVSVGAQSADVIELDRTDATEVRAAWTKLQDAQTKWDALHERMRQKYTLVKEGDPDKGNLSTFINPGTGISGTITFASGCNVISITPTEVAGDCGKPPSKEELARQEKERKEYADAHERYFRKGFENGFEFSKDFRFIVPGVPKTENGIHSGNCWNLGGCGIAY